MHSGVFFSFYNSDIYLDGVHVECRKTDSSYSMVTYYGLLSHDVLNPARVPF